MYGVIKRLSFKYLALARARHINMVSKLKLPVGNAFSLPTSCDELLKQLEENCGEPVDLFKYYLKFYLNGNRREQIIDDILPKIYAKAGEVITLFHPNLELEILPENCSGSVSLTRSQIGTLLAHMLFCTLTPMHKNEFKGASDFRCWLTGSMFGKKDPRIAYLDTLFWYFEDLFQLPEARLQEIVKFERVQLSEDIDWANSSATIDSSLIRLHQEGHIGDMPSKEVEVNFANRIVGFWTTATQEEILIGCSPEMCPVVLLLADPLLPNEIGLIHGAKKISQHTGYGIELKCRPLTPEEQEQYDSNKRVVLCMDAEPIDSWGNEAIKIQLEMPLITRELNKLLIGFTSCPDGMPIATGKWGCGAFGGHAVIKGILQILAASVAKKTLNFYIFGDMEMRELLEEFLQLRNGMKVSDVIKELTSSAVYFSRRPPKTEDGSDILKLLKKYEYTG